MPTHIERVQTYLESRLDDCDLAMRAFLPVLKAFVLDGLSPQAAYGHYDPEG